jgi:beta-lactamase regulating signal transducer with metallopeptidase domain
MNNVVDFLFNVFWQTAVISVAGYVLLKMFSKAPAPKRSLLASSFMFAIIILPLLSSLYSSTGSDLVKFRSKPKLIYYEIQETAADKSESIEKVSASTQQTTTAKISKPIITPQLLTIITQAGGVIWLAGFVFMLIKLLYGLIFLNGFRFSLTLINDDKIRQLMLVAQKTFRIKKIPEVYVSTKIESPITIGLFNPVMILPEKLYAQLTPNELNSIFLHELSHIYHHDHLMGVFKRVIIAINWWNPLVYIISAEHSIAREEVCDNYVLSQISPKVYSGCLVDLAEKTCLISSLPATVGMADKYIKLEERIKNILSRKRRMEMKTGTKVKGIVFTATCVFAIIIGGVQYSFAEIEEAKETLDLKTCHSLIFKGRSLKSEKIKKLEEIFKNNPDDLKTAAQLFGYYQFSTSWKNKDIQNKRKKLTLYLIDKHPECSIFSCYVPLSTLDKDVHNSAIKLWKDQIEKHPENTKILWNAALHLRSVDKDLAEKFLLKGQKLEKGNPRWAQQLGFIYSSKADKKHPEFFLKAYEQFKQAYDETKAGKLHSIIYSLAKSAYKAEKYQEAEKYAREMLWMAKDINKDNYNFLQPLLYNANTILGLLALKNDKIDEACKYLIKSSEFVVPYDSDMTLAYLLYLKGKKECVLKYLQSCAKGRYKDEYIKMIDDVNDGIMPNFIYMLYIKDFSAAYSKIGSMRRKGYLEFGKTISAEAADKLEKELATIPENRTWSARNITTKLLGYYNTKISSDKNIREKKRKLVYRIVKYDPRNSLLAQPVTWLQSETPDKKLIELCKVNIKNYPDDACILVKAAGQLSWHDKKLAEQCLKKCQEMDPKNPAWAKKIEQLHKEP